MASGPQRMPLLDALKGGAALIILVHHLSSYGPLAEALAAMLPVLTAFLFDYGRMVVQVFLVVAGFLAARAFDSGQGRELHPLRLIGQRYLRLAVPFIAAMLVAIVGAAVARLWLVADFIPAPPSLGQLLAHAALLHGVFDVPALSAGVWYVAIDLQLFALFVLLQWVSRRPGAGVQNGIVPVLLLAVLSLFWFNRDADWDFLGIYFFGSYGLGAAAWWISRSEANGRWLAGLLLVTVGALAIDFRLRILIALLTAVLLVVAATRGVLYRWPQSRTTDWLGRISYSVFLVHFPVCMVINAAYARFLPAGNLSAATAILAAIGISLWVGALFHRHVEARRFSLPRLPA